MTDASSRTSANADISAGDDTGPLATLAVLVVKQGVGLGGLPAAQQMAALGLAWSSLARHVVLREVDVNEALKRCLAEECRFLQTDHVELRRWLVDAGWLARDGFGREYRRVATAYLPVEFRSMAEALDTVDTAAWAAGIRDQVAAQREARRMAWRARQAATGEVMTPDRSPVAGRDDPAATSGRRHSDPSDPNGSGTGRP